MGVEALQTQGEEQQTLATSQLWHRLIGAAFMSTTAQQKQEGVMVHLATAHMLQV